MEAITPLLDVKGVTLQYKTKDHLITATYRVDFQVLRSDRFILLGPSGCGKSTLLKAVGGYMAASQPRLSALPTKGTRPAKIRSPANRTRSSTTYISMSSGECAPPE